MTLTNEQTRNIFERAIEREVVDLLYYIEEGLAVTAGKRAERLAQYAFEIRPDLKIKPPVCKHCKKPIEHLPHIKTPCLQWRHASGKYGCNEAKPAASVTYAEPAEAKR